MTLFWENGKTAFQEVIGMKYKKTAALIAAAAILASSTAFSVSAKEWVRVSEWAYNEVSNFRSEGLMPQSFDDVSDYHAVITRGQFAELVYSIADRAGAVPEQAKTAAVFSDTAGAGSAADALSACGVLSGTADGVFSPDSSITREDAAVMLYNAARLIDGRVFDFEYAVQPFADGGDISAYAAEAVEALSALGVVFGDAENRFTPNNSITIEQAVLMTYRLYTELPVFNADSGATVSGDSGEVVLKSFNNGYYESKQGNSLFISDGVNRIMEFETDIYSDLICCTNSTANYVFAVRYDKTTDVYDLDTEGFLFNIPYRVMSCSDKYIFVTTRESSSLFGVYDLNGTEVLPPEYTINDLRGKGYYDVTTTLTEVLDESLISMARRGNYSDIERTTWVGSAVIDLEWDENGAVYGNFASGMKDTGISSNAENAVAVLTNANGCTYFEMTWMGTDEAVSEQLENALDAGDGSYGSIAENSSSYTELYRIELTETTKRIGDDFGVEGLFRISRNGDVLFDNVTGYINYMPPAEDWYDVNGAELLLSFKVNGKDYALSAVISFGSGYGSGDNENARIINKSSDTVEIRLGAVKSCTIDGESISELDSEYSGSIYYNRKYGVSRVFIDTGDYLIWTPMKAKPELGGDTVTGDFYVQYKGSAIGWPVVDTFHGTLTGIGGSGDITLNSDDGRYSFTAARGEAAEQFETSGLSGTREVSEFITDGEPYFAGTPEEQDDYDLQEHDAPVKRIVTDSEGKVMFVVPVEQQEYPLIATTEGDGHDAVGGWKQLCTRVAVYMDRDDKPSKYLVWDTYIAEAIAIVMPENIFAEKTGDIQGEYVVVGDTDE